MSWIFYRRLMCALFTAVSAYGTAYASDYANCLLDRLGQSTNDAATNAGVALCLKAHPGGFSASKAGEGQGVFFKTDPNECTLSKTKGVTNQRAAYLIASACRHLYGEPPRSAAQAPTEFEIYNGPVTPLPSQSPTTKPEIKAPPSAPTQAAVQKPTPRELAEQRKVLSDLNQAAQRIVADYPFLDTPRGAEVLEKIIARRDELIEGGTYPALALQRAANAIAPAYAEVLK